jgi:hypothetical protein
VSEVILYRLYADGTVVPEDEFDERDNAIPFYDDYQEIAIPVPVIDFIVGA